MTRTLLGYCPPNSDTLSQIGLATAVWTPDGHAGGTLTVSVPKGNGCRTPPVDGDEVYSAQLLLLRAFCGQQFRISVSGQGNGYFSTDVEIYADDNSLVLQMQTPGGSTPCAAGASFNVISGENPVTVTSRGCVGAPIDLYVTGTSSLSQEHEITITVTAL